VTDPAADFTTRPADETSVANLAAAGLRYTLVDTADQDAFGAWQHAEDRGFLGAARTVEQIASGLAGLAYRRTTGVYDDTQSAGAQPDGAPWPIATVNSWPAELTLPGSSLEHPRTLRSWAISSVTVAPTHRRRGIARNLLEGELRTAASLGIPMAMLTVSESTIYGRFGFAPAAFVADWTIDTQRARWIAPAASGRVEFVSVGQYRDELPQLHERVRLTSPGEIDVWPLRWDQLTGVTDPDSERTRSLRALRVTDESGTTRGLALYRWSGGEPDFTQHTAIVERLDAEAPDAEAALWRFLLELDLTTTLKAGLRRMDEPVRWQIADFRAATVETREHQYLRVLDVAAVFEARGYWRVAPRGGGAPRRGGGTPREHGARNRDAPRQRPDRHPRPRPHRRGTRRRLPRWCPRHDPRRRWAHHRVDPGRGGRGRRRAPHRSGPLAERLVLTGRPRGQMALAPTTPKREH
jgi:predicted N-acetyltransferase YhbS